MLHLHLSVPLRYFTERPVSGTGASDCIKLRNKLPPMSFLLLEILFCSYTVYEDLHEVTRSFSRHTRALAFAVSHRTIDALIC